MSKSSNQAPVEKFHFPNSQALWHESRGRPQSLGCQHCVFLHTCGGLNVGAGIYDCLTFCRCTTPATCDNVCPNNPSHMVARSMEVRGFELDDVPSAPALDKPVLPHVAPMLFHSAARSRAPVTSAVALSLYEVIRKNDGQVRFPTRQSLFDHFKLTEGVQIILSGTHNDRPLERWWKLSDPQALIRTIRNLGIGLVTTPNFSLFDDVPRHDNLYNMKRIATAWSEIQNEGIPCALHLNARTDQDWERWGAFLKKHKEIDFVAFEFGTGAGAKSRIAWYVDQLQKLAVHVDRPLHLIVRGGLREIEALGRTFSGLTVIDTSAFIRAQKRWRISLRNGKLGWSRSLTLPGKPIDDLLDSNIAGMEEYTRRLLQQYRQESPPSSIYYKQR